jgi:hypothetical protein
MSKLSSMGILAKVLDFAFQQLDLVNALGFRGENMIN